MEKTSILIIYHFVINLHQKYISNQLQNDHAQKITLLSLNLGS